MTEKDPDLGDYRIISCRKARAAKSYTCIVCGGVIPRNTLYYRTVYTSDGKFGYDRSHTGTSPCVTREYETEEDILS